MPLELVSLFPEIFTRPKLSNEFLNVSHVYEQLLARELKDQLKPTADSERVLGVGCEPR